MTQPGVYYAKGNNSVKEGKILHDSTYMRDLK